MSTFGAHHGSLAKDTGVAAEQRLKHGDLQVLLVTAALKLGHRHR